MANRVKLDAEYDGKKYELTVRPATLRKFEKHFNLTWSEYQENPSLDGLYWLAWQTMLSNELTADGYEKWIDGLDDVDIAEIGEEHPKDPAPLSSDNT